MSPLRDCDLTCETDELIASTKIEGAWVFRGDGERMGMIDKKTGGAVYDDARATERHSDTRPPHASDGAKAESPILSRPGVRL